MNSNQSRRWLWYWNSWNWR